MTQSTIEVSTALTEFVRPSEHSLFSPSAADRWIACPYSINASKDIPEETTSYAEEGTLAHKVCEDYFNHVHNGAPESADLLMADDDMMFGARMWYDTVVHWLNDKENIGEVLWFGLEKGIPVFPDDDCFGTADAVIIGTKGCAILDYKYGKRPVSARSTQLQVYLLGVLKNLNFVNAEVFADYGLHAVIVQPRTDTLPKHQSYDTAHMTEFNKVVEQAIQLTKEPDLVPVYDSRHCFWCPARRTTHPDKKCPAIAQREVDAAAEDFEGLFADMSAPVNDLATPNIKRDKALIKILSLLPTLQHIADDARGEFKERLARGEEIPGVVLSEVEGKRQWAIKDSKALAAKLKEKYPEHVTSKEVTTLKVDGITTVERKVGKDNFDNSLTVKKLRKEVTLEDSAIKDAVGELFGYIKNDIQIGG